MRESAVCMWDREHVLCALMYDVGDTKSWTLELDRGALEYECQEIKASFYMNGNQR